MIFQGIRTSIAKKPYIFVFVMGEVGSGRVALVVTLFSRAEYLYDFGRGYNEEHLLGVILIPTSCS